MGQRGPYVRGGSNRRDRSAGIQRGCTTRCIIASEHHLDYPSSRVRGSGARYQGKLKSGADARETRGSAS